MAFVENPKETPDGLIVSEMSAVDAIARAMGRFSGDGISDQFPDKHYTYRDIRTVDDYLMVMLGLDIVEMILQVGPHKSRYETNGFGVGIETIPEMLNRAFDRPSKKKGYE